MRLTKIFKKTRHKPRKFKVPLSWYEVTTKEFCDFMLIKNHNEEMTKVLEVFTGIPAKDWELKDSDSVDMAFASLVFMVDRNEAGELIFAELPTSLDLSKFTNNPDEAKKHIPHEIYINGKPVQVPNDITNPAYAARQDIINAIKTHNGNIIELFTGIAACLLYEAYTKGKYSSDKAQMLIPYIEKIPAYQIVPMVYFFLNNQKLRMMLGIKGYQRPRKVKKLKQE